MCQLNKVGAQFALLDGVKAITDVTGFGLLGHLSEICEGSGVAAVIDYNAVPKLDQIDHYLEQGCSPGGAQRNYDSYGHKIGALTERQQQLLCDPQTSGGLLVAVTPEAEAEFLDMAHNNGFELNSIGELTAHSSGQPLVEIR